MRSTFVPLVSLSLALPASAQTALLREGDPSPDGTPGQTIWILTGTAANQSLGYACSVGTRGPNGFDSQIWGDLSGGAGALVRRTMTIGAFEQTSFSREVGLSPVSICYSGIVDESGGSVDLESLWFDDTLLALEGDPVPVTPKYWVDFGQLGVTQRGVPYFTAGTADTPEAPRQGRAIYFGATPTAVYESGVVYPNMPAPLSELAVGRDFGFSADGTHNIALLDLDVSFAADDVVALDGSGLILGGTLVRQGELVPASLGGTGERWDSLGYCGITESGDYFFTGDTNAPSIEGAFIVRNGSFWARDGDTIGGNVVGGTIDGAFLSEDGQLAYLWDVVDPVTGVRLEALFVEDRLIVKQGDAVDWDGDGSIDPGVVVTGFDFFTDVSIGRDGAVYFIANCDVNGTDLQGYFRSGGGDLGTNYCQANPNSTGVTATMTARGSLDVSTNAFDLYATRLPANTFGFFLNARTSGFLPNPSASEGNLCLGSSFGRFAQQVQDSGSGGLIEIRADLTAFPRPTTTVPVLAGETWYFTAWFRDSSSTGVPTSNFADGLEVTFQ